MTSFDLFVEGESLIALFFIFFLGSSVSTYAFLISSPLEASFPAAYTRDGDQSESRVGEFYSP
jgi:hypothetical protein